MEELSAGKLTVKNSVFFGHLYFIEKKEEIDLIVKYHKKLYHKADHHCYAVNFTDNNKIYNFFKNDGEVGHPGKLLLELLKKYNFDTNVLCVSRIFGGIRLGVGGVSRSFKNIGESVIHHYISKNIHN